MKPTCQLCGKWRGFHKAKTLHCPSGSKGRVGYTQFHASDTFVEKKSSKQRKTGDSHEAFTL